MGAALALPAIGGCARAPARSTPRLELQSLPGFFDDLEQRTFAFFWETANPNNGLLPDRWPSSWAASIASVGFALTAYPIGVERGYITRTQASDRVLTTLRFFAHAPQGVQESGTTGYRGFFYHFLDMQTGTRWLQREVSTVDTALLLAGMLFCQSWFDRSESRDVEIRELVDTIYARVDWNWMQVRPPLICAGWTPEGGFFADDWTGYNEAMLVYLLALGAPLHAIDGPAWAAWTASYERYWGRFQEFEYLGFAPLFGHQYSHLWIDFRGIADAYMRGRGIDYFENSRRATYAQQAYAIANPGHWRGYGQYCWGLTACDGPASTIQTDQGREISFEAYAARGAGVIDSFDDGTIAPTAALASLPFAPEIVIPTAQQMLLRYGGQIYGKYGYRDAFNPSFQYPIPLQNGRIVNGMGWVATDYLGIDQGPILGMIANYRNRLIWDTMRTNPYLAKGLRRAGFTGGWLGS